MLDLSQWKQLTFSLSMTIIASKFVTHVKGSRNLMNASLQTSMRFICTQIKISIPSRGRSLGRTSSASGIWWGWSRRHHSEEICPLQSKQIDFMTQTNMQRLLGNEKKMEFGLRARMEYARNMRLYWNWTRRRWGLVKLQVRTYRSGRRNK